MTQRLDDPSVASVSKASSPHVSVALHFRYREPDEWESSTAVAVRLLARVLWAARPHLKSTGPLLVRMEQLFYTQHLGSAAETKWRDALCLCRRWPRVDAADLGELDNVFHVVLTGRLAHVAHAICGRLNRRSSHALLFGMLVRPDIRIHQALYLTDYSTPIGVLHVHGELELAFESIEYHPEIERMLRRLKFQLSLSDAAFAQAVELLGWRHDPSSGWGPGSRVLGESRRS